MKRYKYLTNNDPEVFRGALDYLKDTQEFTGTADEFFQYVNDWETIPMELSLYFDYRPYLEIMGLQDILDKEIKRIIGKDADKWYRYNEKYGYYITGPRSGDSIIQIEWPIRERTEFKDGGLVPYDEWTTDEDAIKWLSRCVIEEIPETVQPIAGVNVI